MEPCASMSQTDFVTTPYQFTHSHTINKYKPPVIDLFIGKMTGGCRWIEKTPSLILPIQQNQDSSAST